MFPEEIIVIIRPANTLVLFKRKKSSQINDKIIIYEVYK